MNPTIRIDEDVFEALQAQAEPLVDTPNSVLRRVLGLANTQEARSHAVDQVIPGGEARPSRKAARKASRKSRRTGFKRAHPGSTLSDEAYELPILRVLDQKGGRAPTSEVIDALEGQLDGKLTSTDREELSSGQIRWRNRAQFVRLRLVDGGDMAKNSPRGVWEITDQGRRRLEGGSH